MGKFFDTLKKAGSDAIKSISDQLNDAGKNISNTTKDALGNIKDTTVGSTKYVSTAVKNNFVSTAVKNAAAPLKAKLQNFSLNNSLGAFALLPFKDPMVNLLQAKGVIVSDKDSIEKITLLFHDQIVKGKNNLEYANFEHEEESSVDWGKICTEVLGFCKNLWNKRQEEKEKEAIAWAAFTDEQKRMYEQTIAANSTPLEKFTDNTMGIVLGEPKNEKFDFKKLVPFLVFVGIAIVLYKIFK